MWLSSFQAGVLLFLGNVLLSHQAYQDTNRALLFKWRVPEYEYPSEEYKNEAIQQGKLIPQNVLIMDADYFAPTGRYFVTTPLFRPGIPSSLSELVGQEALLRPFPYWPQYDETGTTLSCDGLFSVFRVQIDKCNRMWVLDSGLNYANPAPLGCPPKLLMYDLFNGDREVCASGANSCSSFTFTSVKRPKISPDLLRYTFTKGNYTEFSTLTTFVIESYEDDCSDSIVYITDERFHGLIVYDYAQETSWRIEDPTYYPYPDHHLFDINGIVYSVMAGLFGIALGPNEVNRKLYYHSFASVKEAWVPLDVLKNRTLAMAPNITGPAVVVSPGDRAGQSTVEVMTDDGILIYHLLPENSIVCWNTKTPFTSENQYTLARDDVNFQYIGSLKLKDNNLLITSCRYQNYLYGLEDPTEINYRIMVIEDVKRLLANTPCANSVPSGSSAADFYQRNANVGRNYFAAPQTGYLYNSGYLAEPSPVVSDKQFTGGLTYGKSVDSASLYDSYPQNKYVHGFQYIRSSANPYSNGNNWYSRRSV